MNTSDLRLNMNIYEREGGSYTVAVSTVDKNGYTVGRTNWMRALSNKQDLLQFLLDHFNVTIWNGVLVDVTKQPGPEEPDEDVWTDRISHPQTFGEKERT